MSQGLCTCASMYGQPADPANSPDPEDDPDDDPDEDPSSSSTPTTTSSSSSSSSSSCSAAAITNCQGTAIISGTVTQSFFIDFSTVTACSGSGITSIASSTISEQPSGTIYVHPVSSSGWGEQQNCVLSLMEKPDIDLAGLGACLSTSLTPIPVTGTITLTDSSSAVSASETRSASVSSSSSSQTPSDTPSATPSASKSGTSVQSSSSPSATPENFCKT
jgi:hypothetical protein